MTPTLSTDKLEAILAAHRPAECGINCDDPFCARTHTDSYGPGVRDAYLMARELLASRSTIEDLRRERDEARAALGGQTWIELREPGCVPDRKGPFPPGMVAGFLREVFAARPTAYVTVITLGQDGPLLQDGPECLQMLDGRSMSVGSRHIASSAKAHEAAERELAIVKEGGWKLVLVPEGWVVVPKEPTPKMLEVFYRAPTVVEGFQAMLAAAPLPPAPALNGEQE